MNVEQNFLHMLPQARFSKYRYGVGGIPSVAGMENFAGGNMSQIAALNLD